MTIAIPGYQIAEQIGSGINTFIYRGHRQEDLAPAIMKIMAAEAPTLEDLAKFRHEYDIASNLDLEGIVKPLELLDYQNGLAIVFADFGGESLQKWLAENCLKLSYFLKIAIQLASTLGELHDRQIIHKDIKPQNIIINPETLKVKITDFSIASRLSVETANLVNPNLVEGTLAYMSPEQTGRMNRALDYRSDFYSLGVAFYQLLAGELPFKSSDPMELVHCHIAKQPEPLQQLNPEIPQAVAELVMKLLAKTAEDRYQTARGLKTDLETCLARLEASGAIAPFAIGQQDSTSQFLIPQKLYGREREVAQLMATFERVGAGSTETMLIAGYSGIGKSALVNEVHKPIVRQRGYFIAGKFDQYKRNIPYAALIQAFSSLIRQLLTESDRAIAAWKQKLLAALGDNGQIAIDVIPEVELIIGAQPPVPELGATESQNRFNRVFKEFIHVFTQKDHPLVIFMDDLQWADSASLKLIEILLADPESQYLLLIGAYRDNEVSAAHPLMQTVERLEGAGAAIDRVVLVPLQLNHVSQLVAETLDDTGEERSLPLAELAFNKTGGNPFFLTQLLETLHAEQLLAYNFSEGEWQWDIEHIQAIGITDRNVVELVAGNIQKLPEDTQQVLKLAACIGNQFNLEVLAIVREQSQSDTAAALWSALQAGLILPLSNAYKIAMLGNGEFPIPYKFLHDRVQQAAYSLIPEADKKETHLKIGKKLLENTAPSGRDENIFALVNQLNFGTDIIDNQPEKDQLAELNLIAGRKAKAATAYGSALRYLTTGMELLAADSWQSNYDLTLALYVQSVEAAYLNANYEQAKELADIVLKRAKALLHKVKVYETQMQFYISQNQMQEAIDIGLSVLELLGVTLSESPPPQDIIIEDLYNLSEMTDPYKRAAMVISKNLFAPMLIASPALVPTLAFTMVNLCINYGRSPLAAIAYVLYGLLLCSGLGDIERGYQFGKLALRTVEQFKAREIECQITQIFNSFIRHWKEPTRATIETLRENIQLGLDTGDIANACYTILAYFTNRFAIGDNLILVNREQIQYIELLQNLNQDFQVYYANIWAQIVLNLSGKSTEKQHLKGPFFDEIEMLPILRKTNNLTSLYCTYLAKTILCYSFGDVAGAAANASLASEYEPAVAGLAYMVDRYFYQSLALLALYPKAAIDEEAQYLKRVAVNQKTMKAWADMAPSNFSHKYELVEAEKARVLGQPLAAMDAYELAISSAKDSGYIQNEALALELAGEFYLSRGMDKIAQTYLTEAYYGYGKWGAKAKAEDLEARYPQLLKREALDTQTPVTEVAQTATYTTVGSSAALDLATVMKASQAISSEIVLDKLLEKLTDILMENAGAQKGLLFLEEKGALVLAAEGSVGTKTAIYLPSPLAESIENLPLAIVNYVRRTQSSLVLNNAAQEAMFGSDEYILGNQVKSLLCAPIVNQGKPVGIAYLENNLTTAAFSRDRLEILGLLSGQAAISLDLARSVNQVRDTVASLKAIISNIADGLLVTDTNGRIARFNPALLEMFDLPDLDPSDRDCRETLGSEIGAVVARTFESPTEVLTAEIQLAGGRIGGAVATAILKDTPDECLGSVTLIRDITAEKEVDRMKTDFISTVSHELRTPLTSVVGFAKISHKKLSDKISPALQDSDRKTQRALNQVEQNIGIIVSEGERLTALINDVLDIAKMEAGKIDWQMQEIPISEIIERAAAATQALFATSGLELIKEVEADLPKVTGDRDRLIQVLINLISNAVKFAETGSITLRASRNEGEMIVSVIDTGIGIAPENIEKVFEKFKQVGDTMTDKPKGTGLGLPICKQIVEHHGGRIWAESEGRGSKFSFTLPLEVGHKGDGEKINIDTLIKQLKQSIVPAYPDRSELQKTILVVDDEAPIRELLRQSLEAEGYLVREAADGMEAIAQVQTQRPDLIILDVMMPAIGGFDVAAVLKNNPATMDIPIIILSIVEDKQRGYRLGIDRYLTKPINTEALLQNIGLLLSQGSSKKKVLVVDEDVSAAKILTDILQAKGYSVVEASSGPECIEKAISIQPDMIIVDSLLSQQHDIVKTLRFEKGLENVLFLFLATGDGDGERS